MLHRRAKTVNKDRKQCEVYITLEDLKDQWDRQDGKCFFTGRDLHIKTRDGLGPPTLDQASLDRIDNNKPYEPGNIRFISTIANYALNRYFTDKDLIKFCGQVTENHL